MPKITKIEQQKNENRVSLYVDDEFFMGINKEIVYTLMLKIGQEVEKERLEHIITEEMYLKAKSKALKLLHFSSRTEKEMRERLKKNEYSEETIERVIAFLKEYNFINDSELTKHMVRNKSIGKKYGKKRIKQDLYRKGIDMNLIENTIEEEIDEEKEYENALSLAQKKMKTIKDTDQRKIYEKLGRYLAYRGYEYDLIRKVINRCLK
ncbi:recombination regulator RecX [Crassaminicella profunda]|uniref:recombination regulator RecX n=1 Tax=Crassaminicella profunda TaxID=1286698 RepID=UPI001CA72030|nr:recombination regulator RecX [Crassaminicella profunda]QZY55734.1 recombination regulator RecX [Crassaminicella profunda]